MDGGGAESRSQVHQRSAEGAGNDIMWEKVEKTGGLAQEEAVQGGQLTEQRQDPGHLGAPAQLGSTNQGPRKPWQADVQRHSPEQLAWSPQKCQTHARKDSR